MSSESRRGRRRATNRSSRTNSTTNSLPPTSSQMRDAKVALLAVFAIAATLLCTLQDLSVFTKAASDLLIHRELKVSVAETRGVYRPEKVPLCIITAAYGDDEASVDRPVDVTMHAQHPDLKFFLFTNTEASKVEAPGWKKIVYDLPQYSNRIVQSRWAKFQAFKHETILGNCRSIMYMDANSQFEATIDEIVGLGIVIRVSEQGLAQSRHVQKRHSISEEFKALIKGGLDTSTHVTNSMTWLLQQPDFKDDVPIYQTNHFVYDYHREHVVEMMDYFWERYSEGAGSWRDQPLWAYTVHHFNFEPIVLKRHMVGYSLSQLHKNGHMNNGHDELEFESKTEESK